MTYEHFSPNLEFVHFAAVFGVKRYSFCQAHASCFKRGGCSTACSADGGEPSGYDHDMNAYDHEKMVDVSFRFISWVRKHFPEIKDRLLPSDYKNFATFVREVPIVFWGEVGHLEYDELAAKSDTGESILDRVISIVKETPQNVHGHILIGFVEAHMFSRPDSPLAREMGEALGMDLNDLCRSLYRFVSRAPFTHLLRCGWSAIQRLL